MAKVDSRPFMVWWRVSSGWYEPSHDDGLLSEGHLARQAWNAAIRMAASKVVADGNPEVARAKIMELACDNLPADSTP